METLQVRSDSTAGAAYEILVTTQGGAATNTPREAGQRTPVSIPEAQRYYWSIQWQRDEMESLAEIARGEHVDFDSADDLIRWLLSSD